MSIGDKIHKFFDPNLTKPPSDFWSGVAVWSIVISVFLLIAIINGLFPKLFPFLRDITHTLLIIYGIGYVLAFLLSFFSIFFSLFSFNSLYAKNLRLILMKETLWGDPKEYDEPECPSLKVAMKEFGFGVLNVCVISFLSWFQVFLTIFLLVKYFIGWIMTPSAIKLHRWKLKNVAFQRAEDLLERFRIEGFMPESDFIRKKELKDLSEKSVRLTEDYAMKVFVGNKKRIEHYVIMARNLTKEQNDSIVVHPRFWAIPINEYHAKSAIGDPF